MNLKLTLTTMALGTVIAVGAARAQSLLIGANWWTLQEERWKTNEATIKQALEPAGGDDDTARGTIAAFAAQGLAGAPVFSQEADIAALHRIVFGGKDVSAADPVARRVHHLKKTILRDGKKFRATCTTALVHRRLALTAAHCLPQRDKGERGSLEVQFTLPNKKRANIEVIDWEAHPGDDLALIELASDAPESAKILLLPDRQTDYDPTYITMAGYGDSFGRSEKDDQSGVLRKAIVRVTRYEKDSSRIKIDQTLGSGMCSGDSGGPGLIHDGQFEIFIGIAVYTRGSSTDHPCGSEGNFLHLMPYLDWIYQTARDIQVRTKRPFTQL